MLDRNAELPVLTSPVQSSFSAAEAIGSSHNELSRKIHHCPSPLLYHTLTAQNMAVMNLLGHPHSGICPLWPR